MLTIRTKTAHIAAVALTAMTSAAVQAEAPRIHTHETFCRGVPYQGRAMSILPRSSDHAPAVRSPPQSSCDDKTAIPAECRVGGFTNLEGAAVESGAGQRAAGTIPAKYFHFIWENGL